MRFQRKEGTWAVRSTFHEIKEFLLSRYSETKSLISRRGPRERLVKRLSYLAVLLIQARNGCRVGEAVEALHAFIDTLSKETYVRVEKKYKKDKEGNVIPVDVKRMIVRPKVVTDSDLLLMRNVKENLKKDRVSWWASKRLGLNTHAIRHAFITEMARKDVNPAMLAKMIEWSNLKILLTYINKEEAEKVLRDLEF